MTTEIKNLPEAIVCQGISVRTTNMDETRYETAKLGGLWQKFYQTKLEHLNEEANIYGIYHNYERDDTGEFDVVAGWEVGNYQPEGSQGESESDLKDSLVTVTIPAGKYLVFSESGKMPDMVIDAWEKVWTYFSDPSCEYSRSYEVDFEHYVDNNLEYGQVDLYIGIK